MVVIPRLILDYYSQKYCDLFSVDLNEHISSKNINFYLFDFK